MSASRGCRPGGSRTRSRERARPCRRRRSRATRARTWRSSAAATPGSGRRSRCGSANRSCGVDAGRGGNLRRRAERPERRLLPRLLVGALVGAARARGERVARGSAARARRSCRRCGRSARTCGCEKAGGSTSRPHRRRIGSVTRAVAAARRASGIQTRRGRSSADGSCGAVRSPVFGSGVFFRDGATVHPGLLVRGASSSCDRGRRLACMSARARSPCAMAR